MLTTVCWPHGTEVEEESESQEEIEEENIINNSSSFEANDNMERKRIENGNLLIEKLDQIFVPGGKEVFV